MIYDKEYFWNDWQFVRNLTLKFIETIPSSKLSYSPAHNYGSLGKQLRHMAAIQECYIKGIKNGKIIFENRNRDEQLEKSKKKLVSYFLQQDYELRKLLDSISDLSKIIQWKVWEDLPSPSIFQALLYMKEHEIFHQGILQLSAELAGFKTIRFF